MFLLKPVVYVSALQQYRVSYFRFYSNAARKCE